MGGGFGQKCAVVGGIAVAAAAALTRRPVKWWRTAGRTSGRLQGHEQRHRVRAGFDAEGTILGLSTDIWCDVGAYHCYPFTGGVEPLMAATEMPGPYRLQHYSARTRAVASNKPPMAPSGRVATFTLAMERIMDKAAVRLGLDPAEIRRRNLIRRDEFPYRGATGILYEGELPRGARGVVAAAGYESLRQGHAANASPGNGQAHRGRFVCVLRAHRLRDTGVRRGSWASPRGTRLPTSASTPLGGPPSSPGRSHTVRGTPRPLPRWSPTGCADPDPGSGGPRGHRPFLLRLGNLRQQVGGAVG